MRLLGRSAFITGAAKGIGLSVSRAFSKEGATVALADMSGEEAIRQASEIESETGNKAFGIECDVADKQSVENAIEKAADTFGAIDTLACMAATMTPRHDVVDLSEEEWDRPLSGNVTGSFFACKYAILPILKYKYLK